MRVLIRRYKTRGAAQHCVEENEAQTDFCVSWGKKMKLETKLLYPNRSSRKKNEAQNACVEPAKGVDSVRQA